MDETTKAAELERMHRVINAGLRPRAPEIAVIGFTGDVAVVVHEPGEKAKAEARALGWDGKTDVFRLSEEGRNLLLGSLPAESPTAKWLRRKLEPAAPVARIYVLTGEESLLVNFSPFGGWSVEPTAGGAERPN